MHDDVGKAGDALQADWLVEIAKHGPGTIATPESALPRVAQQRENVVMADQAGQDTARNITATDDQEFLHYPILPD